MNLHKFKFPKIFLLFIENTMTFKISENIFSKFWKISQKNYEGGECGIFDMNFTRENCLYKIYRII